MVGRYTFVVNHSCAPNMFHVEAKNQRTGLNETPFHAIRDIPLGEELTRCYADPPFSSPILHKMAGTGNPGLVVDAQGLYNKITRETRVGRRRALIWAFWGFYCLCTRCGIMPIGGALAPSIGHHRMARLPGPSTIHSLSTIHLRTGTPLVPGRTKNY